MAKLITATHHIALKCHGAEQFEKMVDFYCNVLGLELTRRWGTADVPGAMIDTGNGTRLEINANAVDDPGQGALRHLALATPAAGPHCVLPRPGGRGDRVFPGAVNTESSAARRGGRHNFRPGACLSAAGRL